MTDKGQPRSFAEVTFIEAAARRVRADLVLAPVVPGGQRRLISHFLGLEPAGRLALAPPQTTKGKKVFVPSGWRVGLSFELGNIWFQAATNVVEHAMFQQYETRRVDAMIVEQPRKLLSANRRNTARQRVDRGGGYLVTVWPAARAEDPGLAPLEVGRLHDWSADGLGIRLAAPLGLAPGDEVILRLERAGAEESMFLRGALRHCTACEDGSWIAGFGQLVSLGPGEAVVLMEFVAAPYTR